MIDIVMATFNGEKYIEQQICSLLSQTYKDWNLIVCDDGSTDRTVDIVKRYCSIDSRISIRESSQRSGVAINFLNGICSSTAPYIMLCDQDDIWFDRKVEILLSELLKNEKCSVAGEAILVYGNGYFYSDGVIGGETMFVYPESLKGFLFLNAGIQGCSIIFNAPLRDLILKYQAEVCMHDHYIAFVALAFGRVFYVKQPLMLYRQHATNVTGNNNISLWGRVIRQFLKKRYVVDAAHYRAIESIYSSFGGGVKKDDQEVIDHFLRWPRVNLLKRLWIVFKCGFNVNGCISFILLKTILHKPLGDNSKLKLVSWRGR